MVSGITLWHWSTAVRGRSQLVLLVLSNWVAEYHCNKHYLVKATITAAQPFSLNSNKRQAKKLALNQLRCPRMFTGFHRRKEMNKYFSLCTLLSLVSEVKPFVYAMNLGSRVQLSAPESEL